MPAKPFAQAKSRCAGLGPAARRSLARAMLTDVVRRLRGVPAVCSVVVVATDPEAIGTALASGAGTVGSRRAPDLNGEVGDALGLIGTAAPGTGLALVMGDLAGADTPDYAAALAAAAPHPRAVVGDADGTGTTMLTLRDAEDFRPLLGPGSLSGFLAAGYHDLDVGLTSPLRRDVDTIDQLLSLRPGTLGPATRGWLDASLRAGTELRTDATAHERRIGAL